MSKKGGLIPASAIAGNSSMSTPAMTCLISAYAKQVSGIAFVGLHLLAACLVSKLESLRHVSVYRSGILGSRHPGLRFTPSGPFGSQRGIIIMLESGRTRGRVVESDRHLDSNR
jgi:hypothetical protein